MLLGSAVLDDHDGPQARVGSYAVWEVLLEFSLMRRLECQCSFKIESRLGAPAKTGDHKGLEAGFGERLPSNVRDQIERELTTFSDLLIITRNENGLVRC